MDDPFEGSVGLADDLALLSRGCGRSWPSEQVLVIQLTRSSEIAAERRRKDLTLWPDWTPEAKEAGIKSLEEQVPPPVPTAISTSTDALTEDEELNKIIDALA